MFSVDIESAFLPIVGAIVAGGVIGFEREWRGRAAGLRTHILVCLASSLLMLAGMSQGDWAFEALPDENIVTDPTRMAHGILTGIGFLCAGVIFRTGFSIHGLTTAASLWITSAIGILFGAGLLGLGVVSTLVTAAILIGLRLVSRSLPIYVVIDAVVSWRREGPSPQTEVEAALRVVDPQPRANRFELVDDGRLIRRSWRLKARGEADVPALAAKLAGIAAVQDFALDPRDD